jgi:hypothetical protein
VKMIKVYPLVIAAAVGLTACDDILPTTQLISDAELNSDIAASSGDAIAIAIEGMTANEAATPGMPGASIQPSIMGANSSSLNITRTRVCFDESDAVVNNCQPIASVRKIATHFTLDGSRSGSHQNRRGGISTWEGVVHRVADDTLTRNFNGSTETSRAHTGTATGNDTTDITDGDFSRSVAEGILDSVKAVTWNLPRSSNPFPVSGSIKRVAAIKVVVTKGDRTETRELSRTITVTFPADNQGNVVLTINDKTCQLNLVTHVVSNCQ